MILSHRHRFVFVKTRKTAGTSIELALSAICGPDDVITPVSRPDERLRAGRGPQNHLLPIWRRRWDWPLHLLAGRTNREVPGLTRFWPHMAAGRIRAAVGASLFDRLEIVTVERNPWDREVSNYHWVHRNRRGAKPDFETYVLDERLNIRFRNFEAYSVGGRIVAGRVLRYERLAEDFAAWMADLGIDFAPVLPYAKAGHRPDTNRSYRGDYTEAAREAIARRYAREIAAFGYTF
ncbi:hypothetical protein [Prosthecodimorpha staleyi]|uniref:Sulfotransferase family protein n=1 Tax=Prosthecodimorpha staleyi TaxID=2840188 RepID=A0A947D4J6_9HYPH|nr:hypothetical protein [Prosthecodimorpha staleyi]MBT9288072.1 hypothetical protein [Prosthecodimorpha staleyi]